MADVTFIHDLRPSAPVDLALTVGVLRRLPANLLYPLRDGEFRVVLDLDGVQRLLGVRQVASRHLLVRGLDAPLTGIDSVSAEDALRRLLGLDVDLAPALVAFEAEPVTAALSHTLKGLRPPRFPSLWETLVQVIPFQQVSLAAAMSALNRLVAALGTSVEYDSEAYVRIPSAQRVVEADPDALRACGLSAAKVAVLRGCASWILDGKINDATIAALPDDDAALLLRQLPGIGPWSAQLTLLRGFGRLAQFPSGDSGAARGLRDVFAGSADPTVAAAQTLEGLGRWRGYLYFMLLGRRIQAGG